MKKKIIIVLTCILGLFIIILLMNKTFFRTYYQDDKVRVPVPMYSYLTKVSEKTLVYPVGCCSSEIELSSIRSKAYLDEYIKNYIEYLPSCYDESYFYDSKYNITYNKYIVETSGMYNKVIVAFQSGNYCKDELILESDWLTIAGDGKINESTFPHEALFELLEKSTRLNLIGRIRFDESNQYQIRYSYNHRGFTLYFSVYSPNVIGVTRIDDNDHAKYAIYDIGMDATNFLNNLSK